MLGLRDAAQADDHALVAAAQSGSVQAFELLVERYHAPILRYLTRQTGDPELAADLAQETFLDAFRSLHRLGKEDYSFAAWLHRIARHNLLVAWRWRRLRRLISLDWLLAQTGPVLPALQHNDVLRTTAERDLLQAVLSDLSPTLREALVLYSVQGFSGQEVAQILGIAAPAALQRIARAKEQFRARYWARSGGDDDANL